MESLAGAMEHIRNTRNQASRVNPMEIELNPYDPAALTPISEHQAVEFWCIARPGSLLVLEVGGQPLAPFLRPGEPAWRWRWNPGTATGLHQLELLVRDAGGAELRASWALRVLTRKIDQERYEALIDDLQRVAYRLVATLAGAGAEGATLEPGEPWQHSPLESYYLLFEARLDTFVQAVRRIAARPREQLQATRGRAPLGQAGAIDDQAIAELPRGQFDPAPAEVAAELQAALRPAGGALPRDLATTHGRPSTDTYEHRLLKQLLAQLARRARFVGGLATRAAARLAANEAYTGAPSTRRLRAEQIAQGCAAATRTLQQLRALPFLAEVRALPAFHGPTALLQRDASYREVYRMWQALRREPRLACDSPLFSLPIADLPHLYEVWCALELAQALLALGGEVREQSLVAERGSRDDNELEYVVALNERSPLLVIARGEQTLSLRYQPRYRPARGAAQQAGQLYALDRYTHVPDLAIELRGGDRAARVLLLDAKYRAEPAGHGVPPDALADAYTYLGAIGSGGRRATLGALILYPGTGPHERFASGVGTIALLPGHTGPLAALLTDWLPS